MTQPPLNTPPVQRIDPIAPITQGSRMTPHTPANGESAAHVRTSAEPCEGRLGRKRDADTPVPSDADQWVYICRDDRERVLYVGVTAHGINRFTQGHSRTAPWWRQVKAINVEHFDDRDDTLARERYLISTLKPRYNVAAVELEGDPPDPATLPSRWLRIGELAGWLQVDTETVVGWMADGMPHMLLRDVPRFRASDVNAWLRR